MLKDFYMGLVKDLQAQLDIEISSLISCPNQDRHDLIRGRVIGLQTAINLATSLYKEAVNDFEEAV